MEVKFSRAETLERFFQCGLIGLITQFPELKFDGSNYTLDNVKADDGVDWVEFKRYAFHERFYEAYSQVTLLGKDLSLFHNIGITLQFNEDVRLELSLEDHVYVDDAIEPVPVQIIKYTWDGERWW